MAEWAKPKINTETIRRSWYKVGRQTYFHFSIDAHLRWVEVKSQGFVLKSKSSFSTCVRVKSCNILSKSKLNFKSLDFSPSQI